MLCADELDALQRYRMACQLAYRYNGSIPNSSETAEWIRQVGEARRGADIENLRMRLVRGGYQPRPLPRNAKPIPPGDE
jgi:hypothetical protein